MVRSRIVLAVCVAAFATGAPATAQLTKEQAACVLGVEKSIPNIDKQVTKQASTCLSDFAHAKLVGTVEACVGGDPQAKLAALVTKASAGFTKLCTAPPSGKLADPFPPFGITDVATLGAESSRAGRDLAHDVFGANLDGGALSTVPAAAACQFAAWKALAGCEQARLKQLGACEKAAVAGTATTPAVASKQTLRDTCLGVGTAQQPDAKAAIAKKCSDPAAGIPGALTKKCGGQDLASLLPGCAGAPDVGQCLEQRVACRTCLAVSQAQDLDRDCDLFDDGLDNASCDRGPISIVCQSPLDGQMLQLSPGASVDFQGQASHPFGIDTVTVNGTPVTVAPDGTFSATVPTSFGINFVDVVATNAVGEQRVATCSFLVANAYHAEDTSLDGAVTLRLAGSAIDDGNRGGPVNSLDDVLYQIVNGTSLFSQIDSAFTSANPLKASGCDSQTCTFLGCICFYSSEVDYLGTHVDGPNTVTLSLVNGGLQSVTSVNGVHLNLHVYGDVGPVPYDTSGWVDVNYVQVSMTSDVAMQAGKPHVSVRPGSVNVVVGPISTQFSGVDGWLINNVIIPLAQGPVHDLLRDTVSSYVQTQYTAALDALVSGFELDGGSFIDVTRLDLGLMALSIGGVPSSVSVNPTRALFFMGTAISAPPAQAIPSLGVPIGAPLFIDPSSPVSAAASATNVAVLNQALHALWRGGFLQESIADPIFLSGLPPGSSVDVAALLPPVASAAPGNAINLGIGAVGVTLTEPGFLDEPVSFEIGGNATVGLTGTGPLTVNGFTVNAVHLTDPNAVLDPTSLSLVYAAGEVVAEGLVQVTVGAAARAIVPADFPIPASLAVFGLGGGSLGVVNPTFSVVDPTFTFAGNLGIH
jgi:hypothetical protein